MTVLTKTRLAAAVSLVLVGLGAFAAAAHADPAVPYSDPQANGYIGLCNQQGQQVTSGSIETKPFAWRAVSSVAAQAPYNDDWRTATLFAYQPLDGLPAGDWSGEEITASSNYADVAHPTAAATYGDQSLEEFLEAYPARWDGLVQLRIYLSTRGAQAETLRYPTLDIEVSGDSWHAVDGGLVDCADDTARSVESELLPASETDSPAGSRSSTGDPAVGSLSGSDPVGSRSQPSASSGSTGAVGTAGSLDSGTGEQKEASGEPDSLVSSVHHKHSALPTVLVVVAVLLLIAASGSLLVRRRISTHQATRGTDQ